MVGYDVVANLNNPMEAAIQQMLVDKKAPSLKLFINEFDPVHVHGSSWW